MGSSMGERVGGPGDAGSRFQHDNVKEKTQQRLRHHLETRVARAGHAPWGHQYRAGV